MLKIGCKVKMLSRMHCFLQYVTVLMENSMLLSESGLFSFFFFFFAAFYYFLQWTSQSKEFASLASLASLFFHLLDIL